MQKEIAEVPEEKRVYIDESSIDSFIYREYAYAPRGETVPGEVKGRKYQRSGIVSGLLNKKIIAPMLYTRTMHSIFFKAWFEQQLLPALLEDAVIIMDNASFHRKKQLSALGGRSSHRLLFLPPYSPELNPIKHLWSELKRNLKKNLPSSDSLSDVVSAFFKFIDYIIKNWRFNMNKVNSRTGNTDEQTRARRAELVLWIVMFCNLAVSAAKIVVGMLTGLHSVLADGFHSIADGFSNIVGLVGIRLAHRPVDEDHAYGHRRYETLTSLVIVALLAYLGISILIQSARNIFNPSFRIPSGAELLVVVSTLVFNIFVAVLEDREGVKLGSQILRSDARHTLSDIFVTCGVLVSIFLIKYTEAPAWVDSIVSLAIACLILWTAWGIFHTAADELTDHIAIDPKRIEEIVMEDSDVLTVHKIRSRRSGDMIYVDFHVHCDPNMKLREVHAMTHRLEAVLNERLGMAINCVIHTEDEHNHVIHKS